MLFGLTLTFFASQILAGVAIIADFFSFQFKEGQKIIICFIIAATCIGLHYLLLERYSAAIIVGLGIIRFFIAYKKYLEVLEIYFYSIIFSFDLYLF